MRRYRVRESDLPDAAPRSGAASFHHIEVRGDGTALVYFAPNEALMVFESLDALLAKCGIDRGSLVEIIAESEA